MATVEFGSRYPVTSRTPENIAAIPEGLEESSELADIYTQFPYVRLIKNAYAKAVVMLLPCGRPGEAHESLLYLGRGGSVDRSVIPFYFMLSHQHRRGSPCLIPFASVTKPQSPLLHD